MNTYSQTLYKVKKQKVANEKHTIIIWKSSLLTYVKSNLVKTHRALKKVTDVMEEEKYYIIHYFSSWVIGDDRPLQSSFNTFQKFPGGRHPTSCHYIVSVYVFLNLDNVGIAAILLHLV